MSKLCTLIPQPVHCHQPHVENSFYVANTPINLAPPLPMRRVQLAASRIFTKSKESALSPEASAAIVQVLKIASTINVPFFQTACNTVIAFIQMGEVRLHMRLSGGEEYQGLIAMSSQAAVTNDRQWKLLMDLIKTYAYQISEFVNAISEGQVSDYLAVSDDLRAKIAREAVKDFETYAPFYYIFISRRIIKKT